jgi:hypothetical protein
MFNLCSSERKREEPVVRRMDLAVCFDLSPTAARRMIVERVVEIGAQIGGYFFWLKLCIGLVKFAQNLSQAPFCAPIMGPVWAPIDSFENETRPPSSTPVG